jgi:recombination associated protein RdgC
MLKSSQGLKRATVISVPTPFDMANLEESVKKLEFREVGKTAEESWGFVKPDHTDTWPLIARANDVYVFTLRHDRRVINKTRLSREWNHSIQEKEKSEGRKLNKEERDLLRDEVKTKLYPSTAPNENTYQFIYDSARRLLIVTESNGSAVEFVVEKLNHALKNQGTSIDWKAQNLDPALEQTLTAWLYKPEVLPKQYCFEVGTNMRLENESCKASLANQVAASEEVRVHLHNQKHVGQIELIWNEKIEFVLSSKKILSQMKFKSYCSEKIKEVQEDGSVESTRTYQQATFMIFYDAFIELWEAVNSIPEEL